MEALFEIGSEQNPFDPVLKREATAALEDARMSICRTQPSPYGNYNSAARDVVAESGYLTGLTGARGETNYAKNPFVIPRKGISYGESLIGYFWKLQMKHRRKGKPPETR